MTALWLALLAPIGRAAPTEEPPPAAFAAASGEVSARAWWQEFGDPSLEALLMEALAENGDLEAARQRVRMASGMQVQRFSPLLPTASFEAGVSTGPYENSLCANLANFAALGGIFDALANDPQSLITDPDQFSGGGVQERDLCTTASAMLVAGWQIDLFGRSSLGYASQVHEVAATRADRDNLTLAVATAVAVTWYDLVTSEQQVALLDRQLASQSELLELVTLRYEQGGASGLDVLQQRQQVASTRAFVPSARAGRDARQRSLAALVGRDLEALPTPSGELPDPGALPGVGDPSDLIDRRPDLVAGLERARAARDSRASAQTGLLPTLRLSANTGWNGVFDPTNEQNGVFDVMTQMPVWGAGVGLSIPLFGGGVGHGRVITARAAEAAATRTYDQAVRNALAEADTAIRLDEEQRLRRDAVIAQAAAARSAYDESVQRYLEGLTPYVNVIAAQAAHQAAELALLQSRRDAVVARVQLYDALGQVGRPGSSE